MASAAQAAFLQHSFFSHAWSVLLTIVAEPGTEPTTADRTNWALLVALASCHSWVLQQIWRWSQSQTKKMKQEWNQSIPDLVYSSNLAGKLIRMKIATVKLNNLFLYLPSILGWNLHSLFIPWSHGTARQSAHLSITFCNLYIKQDFKTIKTGLNAHSFPEIH